MTGRPCSGPRSAACWRCSWPRSLRSRCSRSCSCSASSVLRRRPVPLPVVRRGGCIRGATPRRGPRGGLRTNSGAWGEAWRRGGGGDRGKGWGPQRAILFRLPRQEALFTVENARVPRPGPAPRDRDRQSLPAAASAPRRGRSRVPTAVHWLVDCLGTPGLLLVAVVVLSACAESSLPEPERPEIPSREEVFESERLHRPAPTAAVEALEAYQARVCAPGASPRFTEETPGRRRGCFGLGPAEEIRLLEELRKSDPRSADQPKIIERMIANWQDVQDLAALECVSLRIGATPTVREVEDGLGAVYELKGRIERSRTEPAKLCAELLYAYPNYVKRVRCPGDPALPTLPHATDLSEPSGSDWPISESAPPAPSRSPEGI